ncbi:hypothetical protein FAZ78_16505 [Cereibacter changlensis]|uniref:Uncharacterized protein n=1 Tax=Cereibacter changlensis TaxID=402884 RepID=A0A4U0YXX1_9RHOB|nr:hypothetical protein [Cereibacter changlensis]TKA95506.1 hypothetical protein FAZ78_16505 [Cereibacter changlensis]
MTRRKTLLALTILAVLLPPLLPGPLAPEAAAWAKDGRDGGSDRDGDSSGSGRDGRDSDRDDRDDDGDDQDDDRDDRDDDDRDEGDSGGKGSGSSSGDRAPGRASAGPGGVSEREPFGDPGVHVFLSDGGQEVLRDGSYLRLDRAGQVTERRAATPRDRRRLTTLSRSFRAEGQRPETGLAMVDQRRVELRDAQGWVEILDAERYELIDPNGNIVTRRRATARDLARVRQQLGL